MRILFFTLLLFIGSSSFEQSKQIDSLKTILKIGRFEIRSVNALNDLAQYFHYNIDTVLLLSKHAQAISKKINYPKGQAWAELNIGFAYYVRQDSLEAMVHYNKVFIFCEALLSSKKVDNIRDANKMMGVYYNKVGLLHMKNLDFPLALEYFFKGLKLSQEVEDKFEMGRTLGNIGSSYYMISDFKLAQEYCLKSLKMSEEVGDNFMVSSTLLSLGSIYYKQADNSKALESFLKALTISEEMGHKQNICVALTNMAAVYQAQTEYTKALDCLFKSLKITFDLGDKRGVSSNLLQIGAVYYLQNDFSKAMDYQFKALRISEQLGSKPQIATIFTCLGANYTSQQDYAKALECQFNALKIFEELGDKFSAEITLSNIAGLYLNQKDLPKAQEYNLKALKIAEEIGDKLGVGYVYSFMGTNYSLQNEYDKALEYSLKGWEIKNEMGDILGALASLVQLGEFYIKLGNYKEAEISLNKAQSISNEIGPNAVEKDVHFFYSSLYEKTNRPALALEHYKAHVALKDTIFSHENNKKFLRSEMDHAYEKEKSVTDAKHQKEIEKQNAVAEEKSRKQKVIIYSVGAGFSLVLVLALFIYRSNRQKQKANKIITHQKQKVESQKQLIEEKHKEITDSINYAERIQRSFLATKSLLDENLKDYFVLFQPKDVVSGDFYWATKLSNNQFALVTADSTGHGVPGAIMSIANIACLKESVTKGLVEPHEILNETRKLVIDYLKNDGSTEGGKDGMDASLVCFDLQNKKLNYAAANNPVWVVRPSTPSTGLGAAGLGEILEFAPDKMPVGKHDKQHIPFTSNQVELISGDVVYTLTDGLPDQFGGEKGKKFMYKKLKELLISIASDPMELQKEKLNKAFFDWKGDLEQVDDVCVIGVRI